MNTATITPRTPGRQAQVYRLVWRWHFYAGLACLPFVLWLSATGLIYLFKPQLEPRLEQRYAQVVSQGTPLPPHRLVQRALAAVPGTVLNAWQLSDGPGQAQQVLVGKGKDLYRVYLAPDSGEVLHTVRENDRFMRVIFYLHGELLLGDTGSIIVELAASWTILLLLTGLYLWWPRGQGLAGVLYPRLGRGGRGLWRDLHAVSGVWISLLALFLLVSGLPWSKNWGGLLAGLRQWHVAAPVVSDWTVSRRQELARWRQQNVPVGGGAHLAPAHADHPGHDTAAEHAGMAMDDMADMPGMQRPRPVHPAVSSVPPAAPDYRPLDALVPLVAAQQLAAPVLIAPPSQFKPHWSARSDAQNRSLRSELRLQPLPAAVIARGDFAQRPLLDRLIGYGVAIHEGQLFAPLNQILGVLTALGLQLMSWSAIVLWWRRRPQGRLGALPALGQSRYPGLLLTALVLLGIVLPLLGVSMILVWLVERLLLRRLPRCRHVLGLR